MNALDVLSNLPDSILESDLKFCLVSSDKRPFKIDNTPAKPNKLTDFVSLDTLLECKSLSSYAGVGISIQASNIVAIDVDHCFSKEFDVYSADERAKDILERFADYAYCEFSFSGKGLRVLFKFGLIEDYSDRYYIKNEKFGIEFYQPSKSFRYVTVTGKVIADNQIVNSKKELNKIVNGFLNDYMLRPSRKTKAVHTEKLETRSFDELMKLVKATYFRNRQFQDAWFDKAPGSGKDESEKDYKLIATLFETITQDKTLLKQIFESSPYFKSKDSKHIYKWMYQDGRYYNYVYDMVRRAKE